MGAALGATVFVEAKDSWKEPLIFWSLDIRESGDGKTAPMWKLASVFKNRQKEENERYKSEMEYWEKLPKKDRTSFLLPNPPRGYYASDVTIEGLHSDLNAHPTGGLALLLNEASSLLTSQGQYKAGKGSDREAWLRIWDGSDVRIVRKGKTDLISGARVQVAGGIQPAIFAKIFASNDGIFLSDGTVFRGLFTYEPASHYQLTTESWEKSSRECWEQILETTLRWADSRKVEAPLFLRLNSAALELLLNWRNERDILKTDLPSVLRGFVPKSVSYALRLAGVIHFLKAFSDDSEPSEELDAPTMQKGIDTAEYYLGQAVDAVQLLIGEMVEPPKEVSERTQLLAMALKTLRSELDNGRLAVGHILSRYNAIAPAELKIKKARAMGELIRKAGLSTSDGKHRANGTIGACCLEWNEKTEALLEQCPQSPPCPHLLDSSEISNADFGKSKSTMSTGTPSPWWTLRTSQNQNPSSKIKANTAFENKEDNEDIVLGSTVNKSVKRT